jgi:L-lactate dehydrogenase complex protein LldG
VSDAKETLERIRKALGRDPAGRDRPTLPAWRLEGAMPPIAPEALLPKFEEELQKVSGCPHRAATADELANILREIVGSPGALPGGVVLTRNPLLTRLGLEQNLRAWGFSTSVWAEAEAADSAAYRQACFAAPVGISGVDWALAETGSLVLTSSTEGSQLATLAPPTHVALYRRAQLLESLDDVLEQLPLPGGAEGARAGRSVVFVTGVSRTADIEQILIKGVHGPRVLHAVLVEEACLESPRHE